MGLFGVAPMIFAQASDPVLTVEPQTLLLSGGTTTQAVVSIRNVSDAVIHDLVLTAVFGDGITVEIEPARFPELPAGGAVSSVLSLEPDPGSWSGTGLVRLTCRRRIQVGTSPCLATTEMQVAGQQTRSLAEVADLEIYTAATPLDEFHDAPLFVRLINLSSHDLTLKNLDLHSGLRVGKPSVVVIGPEPSLGADTVINAGSAKVYTWTLKASNQARSGKHSALITADLAWDENGQTHRGALAAYQEVQIGVVGESAILSLLGVPSFLMLPGILVFSMFLFLGGSELPESARNLDFTSRGFLLVAITLSLIATAIYPWLTRQLGEERNYLRGYGLGDVIHVWIGSLAAGALMAAVWVASRRSWRYLHAIVIPKIYRGYFEPNPGDGPVTALEKAARSKGSLLSVKARLGTGKEVRGFVYRDDGNHVWVAPYILWQGLEVAPSESIRELKARLKVSADKPSKLAEAFREAHEEGWISLSWGPPKEMDGPTRLPKQNIVPIEGPRLECWQAGMCQ